MNVKAHTRQWNAFNGQKTAFIGGLNSVSYTDGGFARNLLNAEKRQGRSAGRFLLMNGFFEMFHFFSFRQPTISVK